MLWFYLTVGFIYVAIDAILLNLLTVNVISWKFEVYITWEMWVVYLEVVVPIRLRTLNLIIIFVISQLVKFENVHHFVTVDVDALVPEPQHLFVTRQWLRQFELGTNYLSMLYREYFDTFWTFKIIEDNLDTIFTMKTAILIHSSERQLNSLLFFSLVPNAVEEGVIFLFAYFVNFQCLGYKQLLLFELKFL